VNYKVGDVFVYPLYKDQPNLIIVSIGSHSVFYRFEGREREHKISPWTIENEIESGMLRLATPLELLL